MKQSQISIEQSTSHTEQVSQQQLIMQLIQHNDIQGLKNIGVRTKNMNFVEPHQEVDIDNKVTPLISAVYLGKLDVVKLLLENPTIDPDMASQESGHTPLTVSCITGNFEILKILLDFGAEVNKPTLYNQTPFSCCFQRLEESQNVFENRKICLKMAELCLIFGADINWMVDKVKGYTLLMQLAGLKMDMTEQEINLNYEIIRFLIENGADTKLKTNKGKTIYQLANKHQNKENIQYLLNNCKQLYFYNEKWNFNNIQMGQNDSQSNNGLNSNPSPAQIVKMYEEIQQMMLNQTRLSQLQFQQEQMQAVPNNINNSQIYNNNNNNLNNSSVFQSGHQFHQDPNQSIQFYNQAQNPYAQQQQINNDSWIKQQQQELQPMYVQQQLPDQIQQQQMKQSMQVIENLQQQLEMHKNSLKSQQSRQSFGNNQYQYQNYNNNINYHPQNFGQQQQPPQQVQYQPQNYFPQQQQFSPQQQQQQQRIPSYQLDPRINELSMTSAQSQNYQPRSFSSNNNNNNNNNNIYKDSLKNNINAQKSQNEISPNDQQSNLFSKQLQQQQLQQNPYNSYDQNNISQDHQQMTVPKKQHGSPQNVISSTQKNSEQKNLPQINETQESQVYNSQFPQNKSSNQKMQNVKTSNFNNQQEEEEKSQQNTSYIQDSLQQSNFPWEDQEIDSQFQKTQKQNFLNQSQQKSSSQKQRSVTPNPMGYTNDFDNIQIPKINKTYEELLQEQLKNEGQDPYCLGESRKNNHNNQVNNTQTTTSMKNVNNNSQSVNNVKSNKKQNFLKKHTLEKRIYNHNRSDITDEGKEEDQKKNQTQNKEKKPFLLRGEGTAGGKMGAPRDNNNNKNKKNNLNSSSVFSSQFNDILNSTQRENSLQKILQQNNQESSQFDEWNVLSREIENNKESQIVPKQSRKADLEPLYGLSKEQEKDVANKLFEESLMDLDHEKKKFKLENERIGNMRQKIQEALEQFNRQKDLFQKEKQKEIEEFERYKEQEKLKLRQEKKNAETQYKDKFDSELNYHKKEKKQLQDEINKMKEDNKKRDERNKKVFEKLKKDNEVVVKKNKDLTEKILALQEKEKDYKQQIQQLKYKIMDQNRLNQFKKQQNHNKTMPLSKKNHFNNTANLINTSSSQEDDGSKLMENIRNQRKLNKQKQNKKQETDSEDEEEEYFEGENQDSDSQQEENSFSENSDENFEQIEEDSSEMTDQEEIDSEQEEEQKEQLQQQQLQNRNQKKRSLKDKKNIENQQFNKNKNDIKELLSQFGNEKLKIDQISEIPDLNIKHIGSVIDADSFNYQNNAYYKSYQKSKNILQDVLHREVSKSGKVTIEYADGKKEINFPNKVKRIKYPDGYQLVFYQNKDIKQIYKFKNGQFEIHYENGAKEIKFTNGTEKFQFPNGVEKTYYQDGSIQTIDENRVITNLYIDGKQDIIYPDGLKVRQDANGNQINMEEQILEEHEESD
ncbi:Ankyrin repeat-containing domain [Pseudocohnilembus persalinus]|uniref:Ankyrin repeat-containing domain n=1 Tax=Pseudocohnilembus persalinus TaxID=266149 RepID=A0A0V0QSB9_PSEPJ|nr:Ankyrin repeat-containing domain [Pseudocohnilembus persalinus]|eukprot:KRX04938.1 Ankyrin repeat-containing domain [Pseudocohnilembus persalinus]